MRVHQRIPLCPVFSLMVRGSPIPLSPNTALACQIPPLWWARLCPENPPSVERRRECPLISTRARRWCPGVYPMDVYVFHECFMPYPPHPQVRCSPHELCKSAKSPVLAASVVLQLQGDDTKMILARIANATMPAVPSSTAQPKLSNV